jgi:hypothetical protein
MEACFGSDGPPLVNGTTRREFGQQIQSLVPTLREVSIPKRKAESRKRGDRSLALGIMLMLVAVTAGLWWPSLAVKA